MSLKKITCVQLWHGYVRKPEIHILIYLTHGLSIADIAKLLKVSEDTIHNYLAILKEDGLY